MSAVLISLGSNLGGRAGYLRSALRKIAEFAAIERTSFLYETEPMHVLEQPRFLNAAAALRTTLTPHELLAALQSVERTLGRDHANGVRYGPRVIDLDIVRYGDWSDVVATDDLAIPHPRLAEREFVLRPLLDLVPDDIELRRMVGALEASSHPPRRVLALDRCGSRCDDAASDARETTLAWGAGGDGAAVMGIVNATPDSFSGDGIVGGDDDDDDDDDGELETSYVQRAADQAERMVAAGAAMIDVGGQSTRPGALSVGAEAEAARVVPVIAELRRRELGVPVSVDTYFASVARAAVAAGANAVNDISAGALDPTMAATLGELGVPAMLMHTRGTPATMQSLAEYAAGEVVATVATELSPRVTEFEKAGVPRWDIVIDPGVGFAKTTEHNLEVLRGLRELRTHADYPTLVGLSRKRFLGELCEGSASGASDDAAARVWGTAAACAVAVAEGADIIRVHDVDVMVDVATVASSLRGTSIPSTTEKCTM